MVPCSMQWVLVDDFVKSSVCMSVWTSSFLPALLFSSLGTISLWGHFSFVKKLKKKKKKKFICLHV